MTNANAPGTVSASIRRTLIIHVHGIPAADQYHIVIGELETRTTRSMANASDEGRRHLLRGYLQERAAVNRAYQGRERR